MQDSDPAVDVLFLVNHMISGINQPETIVKGNSTSGEASVLRPCRNKGNGKRLPVNQVLASCVPPVHRTPFGGIRIVLIEQMIIAVVV